MDSCPGAWGFIPQLVGCQQPHWPAGLSSSPVREQSHQVSQTSVTVRTCWFESIFSITSFVWLNREMAASLYGRQVPLSSLPRTAHLQTNTFNRTQSKAGTATRTFKNNIKKHEYINRTGYSATGCRPSGHLLGVHEGGLDRGAGRHALRTPQPDGDAGMEHGQAVLALGQHSDGPGLACVLAHGKRRGNHHALVPRACAARRASRSASHHQGRRVPRGTGASWISGNNVDNHECRCCRCWSTSSARKVETLEGAVAQDVRVGIGLVRESKCPGLVMVDRMGSIFHGPLGALQRKEGGWY